MSTRQCIFYRTVLAGPYGGMIKWAFWCMIQGTKYSFWPRTIVDWNNLPPDLVTIDSVQVFNMAVAKYFDYLN